MTKWVEVEPSEFFKVKEEKNLSATGCYTNMSDSYAETTFGDDSGDVLKTIHYMGIHNVPNYYIKEQQK